MGGAGWSYDSRRLPSVKHTYSVSVSNHCLARTNSAYETIVCIYTKFSVK